MAKMILTVEEAKDLLEVAIKKATGMDYEIEISIPNKIIPLNPMPTIWPGIDTGFDKITCHLCGKVYNKGTYHSCVWTRTTGGTYTCQEQSK